MSKIKTGLISAVITSFVAFLNYTTLEDFSGFVRLVSIVVSGLAIGICQGYFAGEIKPTAVGWGAFCGILVLMLPAIAATYGFALLALPFPALFGILVFFGVRLGNNLRSESCRSA